MTHALNGAAIFDKTPSYSSSEVYHRIASFTPAGIYLYKQFTYTTDVLFPVTMFVFLALLCRYTSQHVGLSRPIQITLLCIPGTWFVSDMLENFIVFRLLQILPAKNEFLAATLGYVTIIKFSLLLLSVSVPGLIKAFEKRFIGKFSSSGVRF
ncbi:MAG: hypothetical protein ABI663_07005 [Chryseolinea sp.]